MCDFMCWCVDCGIFFFDQKTAYEMRISDWSSDMCSSDLLVRDVELFEDMDRMRHGRPVRLAAHDDAHLRRRCAHFSTLLPRRFIAAPPPSAFAAAGQRPLLRRAVPAWYEVAVIHGTHTDRRRSDGCVFGCPSRLPHRP